MLEDLIVAMDDLQHVLFTLAVETTPHTAAIPEISGVRGAIEVAVFLPPSTWRHVPKELQAGYVFRIVPILISQGVNEMQTIANKMGDTEVQEQVQGGVPGYGGGLFLVH